MKTCDTDLWIDRQKTCSDTDSNTYGNLGRGFHLSS